MGGVGVRVLERVGEGRERVKLGDYTLSLILPFSSLPPSRQGKEQHNIGMSRREIVFSVC